MSTYIGKQRGASSILSSISGVSRRGSYRVANAANIGWAVYIGRNALPDFTAAPEGFSTTLPISVPMSAPVSGTDTLNVVVRKRNAYGLESQNQWITPLTIDSVGNLILPEIPIPLSVQVHQVADGGIQVVGYYPTYDLDVYPASKWQIWVGTSPPNPSIDTPTAQVTALGTTLAKTLTGPFTPNLYYVKVALFRNSDSARSPVVALELEYLAAPAEPQAVAGCFVSP